MPIESPNHVDPVLSIILANIASKVQLLPNLAISFSMVSRCSSSYDVIASDRETELDGTAKSLHPYYCVSDNLHVFIPLS